MVEKQIHADDVEDKKKNMYSISFHPRSEDILPVFVYIPFMLIKFWQRILEWNFIHAPQPAYLLWHTRALRLNLLK